MSKSIRFDKYVFIVLFGMMSVVATRVAVSKSWTNRLEGINQPVLGLQLGDASDNQTGNPRLGSSGDLQNSLRDDLQNGGSLDCDRVSAIEVSTNGVALTLHRPETNALEAVEVTMSRLATTITGTVSTTHPSCAGSTVTLLERTEG